MTSVSRLTYIHFSLMTDMIASGDPLDQVHEEGKRGFDFASKARFGLIVDVMTGHLLFIRAMRGLTPRFGSFDDAQFDFFSRTLSGTKEQQPRWTVIGYSSHEDDVSNRKTDLAMAVEKWHSHALASH